MIQHAVVWLHWQEERLQRNALTERGVRVSYQVIWVLCIFLILLWMGSIFGACDIRPKRRTVCALKWPYLICRPHVLLMCSRHGSSTSWLWYLRLCCHWSSRFSIGLPQGHESLFFFLSLAFVLRVAATILSLYNILHSQCCLCTTWLLQSMFALYSILHSQCWGCTARCSHNVDFMHHHTALTMFTSYNTIIAVTMLTPYSILRSQCWIRTAYRSHKVGFVQHIAVTMLKLYSTSQSQC